MWWIIFFAILIIVFGILGSNHETNKKNQRAVSIQSKLSGIDNFRVSRQINGYGGFYTFAIDEINKKISYVSDTDRKVVNFSDIIGVEIIEDGNIISKKSITRTIGGAIAGGLIAGGAGTIVGGLSGNSTQKKKVTSLSVKILLRSLETPSILIKCFDSRTMTIEHKSSLETEGKIESYIYKIGQNNANEIKDLVSIIIDNTNNNIEINTNHKLNANNNSGIYTNNELNANKITHSIADEIKKLNELKERGILSEDEYKQQKAKILNN